MRRNKEENEKDTIKSNIEGKETHILKRGERVRDTYIRRDGGRKSQNREE